MSKSRKMRLTIDAFDTLIEELEGVHGLLPDAYWSIGEEDEEDIEVEAGSIESEEIEVALSSIVTTMTDKCDLAIEPDSFSELIESLFGSGDDLVSLAINIEDAINGYFGELFGEDLSLAKTYFSDLIELLSERRKKWKRPKN